MLITETFDDEDDLDYQGVVDDVAQLLTNSTEQLKDWLVNAAIAFDNGSRSTRAKYERAIPGFANMFVNIHGLELVVSGRDILNSHRRIRDTFEKIFDPEPYTISLQIQERRAMLDQLKNLGSALRRVETKFSSKKPDTNAEAPPTAPLGQFAFAQNRTDKVPFESNTEIENKLFQRLSGYFTENIPIKDEDVETLKAFLKKGLYSPVIHVPNVPVVYRGMNVRREWLSKAIKKPTSLLGKKGTLEKSFTFAPKHSASSWSESKAVAKKFTKEDDSGSLGDRYYSVVMHASVESNSNKFIACPKGLYKVDAFASFKSEKEALGLGDIKVFKIEWETQAEDDEGWTSLRTILIMYDIVIFKRWFDIHIS